MLGREDVEIRRTQTHTQSPRSCMDLLPVLCMYISSYSRDVLVPTRMPRNGDNQAASLHKAKHREMRSDAGVAYYGLTTNHESHCRVQCLVFHVDAQTRSESDTADIFPLSVHYTSHRERQRGLICTNAFSSAAIQHSPFSLSLFFPLC